MLIFVEMRETHAAHKDARCSHHVEMQLRRRLGPAEWNQRVDGIGMKCWTKREPQIAAECIFQKTKPERRMQSQSGYLRGPLDLWDMGTKVNIKVHADKASRVNV